MNGVFLSSPVNVGLQPAINLGLGSGWNYFDLDSAEVLAWCLDHFGKSDVSELFGDGTPYPFGIGLPALMRIAYRVKAYDITGTIDDANDQTTEIYRFADPAPDLQPTTQGQLLCFNYEHNTQTFAEGDYQTLIRMGSGFKYSGSYYPNIAAGININGGQSVTSQSSATPVGVFNFYGMMTNLYEVTPSIPAVSGDISAAESDTW